MLPFSPPASRASLQDSPVTHIFRLFHRKRFSKPLLHVKMMFGGKIDDLDCLYYFIYIPSRPSAAGLKIHCYRHFSLDII